MPVSANPIDLTTVADVKTWVGIDGTDSDDVLQLLITAASQYVVDFCGRDFHAADYNEWYSGTGNTVLMLRQTPVNSVAGVSINGRSWNDKLIDPSQYGNFGIALEPNGWGLIMVGGLYWCRGPRNINVQYNAGYTTIPTDLAQAVNEMVGDKYQKRTNIGIQSRVIANETITYTAGDVPKSAQSVLNVYQRAVTLIK